MALKWYSNKAERWSGRPTKSSAEFKQMERKIWLYKIRAEIEKEVGCGNNNNNNNNKLFFFYLNCTDNHDVAKIN